MHTFNMRTNVNLADDAREFADLYAYANDITLGDAISELIRKSYPAASLPAKTTKFGRSASGFPTIPRKNRILTTEMVLRAQEEDFV